MQEEVADLSVGAGIQNPTEPEPPGRRAQFGAGPDPEVRAIV